jgi:hypothetical protein
MRKLLLTSLVILTLSSCLKNSIADAMLDEQKSAGQAGSPALATLTYTINGTKVTTSVNDPDNQMPSGYQLGCSKTVYSGTNSIVYSLDCVGSTGEMGFTFFTDSLMVGNYLYTGIYGDMFILSYNGTDEFVHDPSDSISFNVTSYSQGHISGNFSGRLTTMITAGNPNNTYGPPGSVLITNGSFKDVPVFY